jgi:hypothetical protein
VYKNITAILEGDINEAGFMDDDFDDFEISGLCQNSSSLGTSNKRNSICNSDISKKRQLVSPLDNQNIKRRSIQSSRDDVSVFISLTSILGGKSRPKLLSIDTSKSEALLFDGGSSTFMLLLPGVENNGRLRDDIDVIMLNLSMIGKFSFSFLHTIILFIK